MTEFDQELETLGRQWRDAAPARRAARITRLARWRAGLMPSIEIGVALTGLAFGVFTLSTGGFALGLSISAYSGAALVIRLMAFRESLRVPTESIREEFARELEQTRRRYRSAWAGAWIGVAAIVFLAALMPIMALDLQAEAELPRFAIAFSIALLFVAGHFALVLFSLKRVRDALVRLNLLSAEYSGDPGRTG